jgi:steroid 5-alpha reductase family enzyme
MLVWTQLIPLNFILLLALFSAVWFLSVLLTDAGIVDIFWGAGFVLVAWTSAFWGHGDLFRKVLLTTLTTLWGVRLAVHIFLRSRGKGEDFRYRRFRENGGEHFRRNSLFTIFWLQAALCFVIALPVQIGQAVPTAASLGALEILGALVWTVGFLFEALADFQLRAFLAHPENRGKVMRYGLWRYSRHPNYFGECLVWWGIFLIALPVPGGAFAVVGPLLITFLLLKVSGVTMLEDGLKSRREGYADYIRSTSAFVPGFPKKE